MISTIKDILARYDALKNYYQFSQESKVFQATLDGMTSKFEQDAFKS